jgi:aspartate kinase
MKVFKFGGASVKNASAVKNVAHILSLFPERIFVVVSAMGKTTNQLEKLTDAYFYKNDDTLKILNEIKDFHFTILNELFDNKKHAAFDKVNNFFVELEWIIEDNPTGSYDYEYDQIISIGELISTTIIHEYLKETGRNNLWVDARDFMKTDNNYREAKVDLISSESLLTNEILNKNNSCQLFVTQGFIGVTSENFNTTLGREGSDYTAALIAYFTNATDVIIWKDVPGVLNADPKFFNDTKLLSHISYLEAIELAYFGATVIHPKTIKPLQNKSIPLHVKSFLNPELKGTLIDNVTSSDSLIPSFIFKVNQLLISISPHDFSFIVEENLSNLFALFAQHKVKINLMQNAAISFSVCVDYDNKKINNLIEALKKSYKVLYNENVQLITIRHYDDETIEKVTKNKVVLLEQKTRQTARFVVV